MSDLIYNVEVIYNGPVNPSFDDFLEDIATANGWHGKHSGSGFCFIDSERDISWDYDDELNAEQAANRLAACPDVKKVILTTCSESGNSIEKKEIK